jgi:hypothetical protein
MPQRKLNALGTFGAHSMVANSEERMAALRTTLDLAVSLAEIKRVKAEAQKKKAARKAAAAKAARQKKDEAGANKVRYQEELVVAAPALILRMARGKTLKTKKEFQAVAEVWFPPLDSPQPGQLQLPNKMKLGGEGGMKARFTAFLETPEGQMRKASLPGLLAAAAAAAPAAAAAAAAAGGDGGPAGGTGPTPALAVAAVALPPLPPADAGGGGAPTNSATAVVAATPDSPAAAAAVPVGGKRKHVERGDGTATTNGNKRAKERKPSVPVAARRTSGRRPAPTKKVVEMAERAAARGGNSSNPRKRKISGGRGGPVGTLVGAHDRSWATAV